MTDPSSTPSSGSGSGNAWPTNPTDNPPASSLDATRAGTSSSTNTGSFAGSAGGAPASSAADADSTGTNPSGPGTTAAAGANLPLPDRLARNAATLTYLRHCHAEVLSSLRSAQTATAPLQQRLAELNARAQTEHVNLETARRKLADALYVNAHLREENDMIRTDDDRWAFQVEQREEQLESLTELLAKLEAQQAAIDERKRSEEAAMVRRLEAERAAMVRWTVVAERERMLAHEGGEGAVGAGGAGAGGVEGMPILPKGTGEMSRMLALAPEWTPLSSSAGGGGSGMGGGAGAGYHPATATARGGGGGGGQQRQQQPRAATSLSEAIAIEPHVPNAGAGAGGGGAGGAGMGMGTSSGAADDAASAVSALTADM